KTDDRSVAFTAAVCRTARLAIQRFFFSSRRRHTRSKRDWSSDVCSSDLELREERRVLPAYPQGVHHQRVHAEVGTSVRKLQRGRSEERRVGKECRCRRTVEQAKDSIAANSAPASSATPPRQLASITRRPI